MLPRGRLGLIYYIFIASSVILTTKALPEDEDVVATTTELGDLTWAWNTTTTTTTTRTTTTSTSTSTRQPASTTIYAAAIAPTMTMPTSTTSTSTTSTSTEEEEETNLVTEEYLSTSMAVEWSPDEDIIVEEYLRDFLASYGGDGRDSGVKGAANTTTNRPTGHDGIHRTWLELSLASVSVSAAIVAATMSGFER